MLTSGGAQEIRKLGADIQTEATRRLAEPISQASVFDVIRWGRERIDVTLRNSPRADKTRIACRQGCDHCCRVSMDVQAHEVLSVAAVLLEPQNSGILARAIAIADKHRKKTRGLSADARDKLEVVCPALDDESGECSVYESRPEVCRSHHTCNWMACRDRLTDRSIPIHRYYLHPLRERLLAVMCSFDQAVANAGYDGRNYDFGSALHEALTNDECLARWLQKLPAFPDDCVAPPPIPGGPLGGFTRGA